MMFLIPVAPALAQRRLVFDGGVKLRGRLLIMVEDASVVMLPYPPHIEDGDGCEALASGGWRLVGRSCPPCMEGGVAIW